MPFKTFTVGEVLTAGDVNNYLAKQAVISCTSGTRPSSPGAGMTIYETDTNLLRIYDGSGWALIGQYWPATTTDRQGGAYTITNTAFDVTTTGGTYASCGLAFTAPVSGSAVIHYTAQLSNSGASSSTFVAPVVRTGAVVGSGSSVLVGTDGNAVKNTGTTDPRFGAHYLVAGLTAGSSYNVRLEHRVDAGTGSIRNRSVTVAPVT
ncbi:hypothetical protein [Micromonospora chokoriensis]|uniref:hypothetical protein n=1 Tax=Micromonospora chokoriensis TaxID=356851 RepID=UPI0004C33830|nr:hypothetical protein [Micromonospora chokoriensis]